MQSFFFIFIYIQKIAPQIAKKAVSTNPTPTRHPIGPYSANMEATEHTRDGCSSWTADPGPLIQVDPSSDGPSIPGHPGPGQGHLIPLILSGGSWTIPGHRGRRDILDYPDGSRWIPMDPHPMGRGFSCIRWAGHPMGRWIYLYIQHPPSLIGSARG